MFSDNDGNLVEQNGNGLNEADEFENVPDSGAINVVKCSNCGQIVIYTRDMIQTTLEEWKCHKCGNMLGNW